MIELYVSAGGEMSALSAVEDSIDDPELTECAMSLFNASHVPPPEGGCARVRVPLRFVPKKPEEAPPPP